MNWADVIEKIEPEIKQIVEDAGYMFVDLVHRREGRSSILSVVIHKDPSVSLKDCEKVSRRVELFLDSVDIIPQRYILEVTSPGLDRKIRRDFEYDIFKGRIARITFIDDEGKVRTTEATLVGIQDEELVVEKDGSLYRIPLSSIKKAVLIPQI
ncbi:ribosome maturation factor [bacterium 3DAC]|jgi:ribosome maturation factor RimP|nr:ribosome maturation factor [Dictyoglomota bacterium]UZN23399.1 ribosome maturation factor [bacterium 3DAC]